jgi:hypothetical protein
MTAVLTSAAVVVLVIAAMFCLLLWKMLSTAKGPSIDADWLREFSVARYRPMQRLLSGDDDEFLEKQPGYRPRIKRKLRMERRAIFRSYLRCLAQDFDQLCVAIKALTLVSAQDRPDLAVALLKQKCLFAYGMLLVHTRLILHRIGVGAVDISPLLDSLDMMRLQLQQLAPRAEVSVAAL